MNSDKESSGSAGMSIRHASIVAGTGLLLMAILAPIANFNALQNLTVADDASATAAKITASLGLFRTGVLFFLIVAVLDVIVAWALYFLFVPVSKSLSLLAAGFRVVYAAVFVTAINHLFHVQSLLSGADFLKAFEAKQLSAQVMVQLNAFQSGWISGMLIFGLHLLVLGYLVFRSGYLPKFLGILVVIAGFGYLIDSLGKLFIPGYIMTISMFTFIGEVLLIFWLLWRGFNGYKTSGGTNQK
jgi:hypothetical protein